MAKITIWPLFAIGAFAVAVGAMGGNILGMGCVPGLGCTEGSAIFVGVLILAIAIFLAFRPEGVLRKGEVVGSWSALIEGGQGKSEEVIKETRQFLSDSKAPSLHPPCIHP